MLKPTDMPPASLQPRFAASITPGPPPVTTANPAFANSRRGLAREAIRPRVLAHPRRPEDRHRRAADLVDLLEPVQELGRDERDVGRDLAVVPPQ